MYKLWNSTTESTSYRKLFMSRRRPLGKGVTLKVREVTQLSHLRDKLWWLLFPDQGFSRISGSKGDHREIDRSPRSDGERDETKSSPRSSLTTAETLVTRSTEADPTMNSESTRVSERRFVNGRVKKGVTIRKGWHGSSYQVRICPALYSYVLGSKQHSLVSDQQ